MEYLISQSSDDTSIYLDGSRESFENVIKIITECALWSGLKINCDESQVVWLGSQKGSATVFLPYLKLKWNPTRFSVLGIIYSTDLKKKKKKKKFYEFIWNGKRDKIKRTMLCKSLEKGGLNMVEINVFTDSLKVTWIRKMLKKDK